MTTMVERVARAIDPKAYEQEAIARQFVESSGRAWEGSWEQSVHKSKTDIALKNARAGVEAVRKHLIEIMRVPPRPYFWPDGSLVTLAKVDAVLKGSAP